MCVHDIPGYPPVQQNPVQMCDLCLSGEGGGGTGTVLQVVPSNDDDMEHQFVNNKSIRGQFNIISNWVCIIS